MEYIIALISGIVIGSLITWRKLKKAYKANVEGIQKSNLDLVTELRGSKQRLENEVNTQTEKASMLETKNQELQTSFDNAMMALARAQRRYEEALEAERQKRERAEEERLTMTGRAVVRHEDEKAISDRTLLKIETILETAGWLQDQVQGTPEEWARVLRNIVGAIKYNKAISHQQTSNDGRLPANGNNTQVVRDQVNRRETGDS